MDQYYYLGPYYKCKIEYIEKDISFYECVNRYCKKKGKIFDSNIENKYCSKCGKELIKTEGKKVVNKAYCYDFEGLKWIGLLSVSDKVYDYYALEADTKQLEDGMAIEQEVTDVNYEISCFREKYKEQYYKMLEVYQEVEIKYGLLLVNYYE